MGFALLIINTFLLITGFLKFLAALIVFPNFYSYLLPIISKDGQYGLILFYLFMSLDTLCALWGIVLSIILIKNNSYNKQLLWWVYSLVGIKVLSFILYLPLKSYMFADLATAVLVYLLLIHYNNNLSKLIKNKVK